MRLTRRSILRTGALAAVSPLFGQAPFPATSARAQEREHILLGLKKALDHIDEVIKTRKSSN